MFLTIKFIHIISATLLFGTGLGSAFYLFMAYRTGNMAAMAVTNRLVVFADFLFTVPTVIIQFITGLYLLNAVNQPLDSTWTISVIILYLFIGACWLPVAWLQIWLKNRAQELETLDAQYHYRMRVWMILGALAFPAVITIYIFMVFKPFWE